MPTSIPKVEDMLKFASERTGKTIKQLKSEIEKYSKQFADVVRTERLMTYLYLKNVLGLSPAITLPSEGKTLTIEEIVKSPATSKINTRGFIIRQWKYKAGDQKKPAYGFILADNTGTMRGDAMWEGFKVWDEAKIKTLDFVEIKNCGVNEYKGAKRLRVSGQTSVTKKDSKKVKYGLKNFITKLSEIGKSDTELIQVSFLTITETSYLGCPYCTRKIKDVEEGQRAQCPKCGIVTVERLRWIKGLVSDGEDDIEISIPPRLVKKIGSQINPSGIYLFTGRWRKDRKEFIADELLKHISGEQATTVEGKFEIGKPSLEQVKRKIPLFIRSWKSIKEEDLIENVKAYLNADTKIINKAIKELLSENKIKLEDGTYQAVD